MPPPIAENIVALFREVYAIGKHWEARWSPQPMRFWFRGVDDINYSLDPSLLRSPYYGEDLEQIEYEIANDFRIRGRPYFSSKPESGWEELFLMQHYGFPTRLLDWSESLAAAAYFATRDIRSSVDGAVWVMAPHWLTFKAHGEHAHLPTTHPWLQPFKLRTTRTNNNEFKRLGPLPILPDHVDTRIIAQRGRFTVHTFEQAALADLAAEDHAAHGNGCFLQKICIPVAAKATVREQARIFGGACEDTLFPDLEGLARGMRWEALERAKNNG